ncbi:N-acetylmuramoyl-L-alanine amidase [Alloiococcus sp. CFN-8]|uniref:N-acetylmuramoyl-L-alanine amidase n=1 Tax=Alloiococcus sp. CFN-8 TaxID=3416081 RepID=UPI003CE8F08D
MVKLNKRLSVFLCCVLVLLQLIVFPGSLISAGEVGSKPNGVYLQGLNKVEGSGGLQYYFQGIILSHEGVEAASVYVDGRYVQEAELIPLEVLPEEHKTFQGIMNYQFKATVNLESYNEGGHEVAIEAAFKDGTYETITNYVEVTKEGNSQQKALSRNRSAITNNSAAITAVPSDKANSRKLIIIDPGHGGKDPGAVATHNGVTYREADYNILLATKLKDRLEAYGYDVLMTRTGNQFLELYERTDMANSTKAIFFISIHHDSSTSSTANGTSTHFSTYKPNIDQEGLYVKDGITYDSTPSQPAVEGRDISLKLAPIISDLGFTNRKAQDHNLFVTRNTNMASTLVEGGFISSPIDILKIHDGFVQNNMAQAIAKTLHEKYSYALSLPPISYTGVSYQAHVGDIGWQSYVFNGDMAGTEGKNKGIEALNIALSQMSGLGVTYRAHVSNVGWQDWVQEGALAGTTGKAQNIEALEIKLTGEAASKHSIQYQVHVQDIGWMDWAIDGNMAGTTGKAKKVEAIRIKITEKVQPAPTISYEAHVRDIGWMAPVSGGEIAGTTGRALTMEALKITATNMPHGVQLEYRGHVQDIGWLEWTAVNNIVGTTGRAKNLEAIEIRLIGPNAGKYTVAYQAHIRNIGWQSLVSDGYTAGTIGRNLPIEALKVNVKLK